MNLKCKAIPSLAVGLAVALNLASCGVATERLESAGSVETGLESPAESEQGSTGGEPDSGSSGAVPNEAVDDAPDSGSSGASSDGQVDDALVADANEGQDPGVTDDESAVTVPPAAPQENGQIDREAAIRAYTEAYVKNEWAEVAAPDSAAALILRLISDLDDPRFTDTVLEVTEDSFTTRSIGEGRDDTRTSTEVVVGLTGVEDWLSHDGIRLSERISTVLEPVVTADGLQASSGHSNLNSHGHRITSVLVENGSTEDLLVDRFKFSFVQSNDTESSHDESRFINFSVDMIPAGGSGRVVVISSARDDSPNGVARYPFTGADSGKSYEIDVPFGDTLPSFFELDEETGGVKGELSSDIAFETGSAELSTEALRILRKAQAEIERLGRDFDPLCIEGHADSVGDAAANLELSQARADSVAAAFVSLGMTQPIATVGRGEEFAPGNEQADANARRVDISFTSECQ